jgi:MSP (Major sperm protein) domain
MPASLCGSVVLRCTSSDTSMVFSVVSAQPLLYTVTPAQGIISPGSNMTVKVEVIEENTDSPIELDDLMNILQSASSHTFLIQSATARSSTKEQGVLEIDDNRQQEIRCSTQTAARLNRIAGEYTCWQMCI